MNVVETSGGGAVSRCLVNREESLPALTGSAICGIVQQIRFSCEAQKDGHRNALRRPGAARRFRQGIAMPLFPALVIVFENQLRDKKRAFEIREWIAKSLRRVHAPKRIEISRSVFADAHK